MKRQMNIDTLRKSGIALVVALFACFWCSSAFAQTSGGNISVEPSVYAGDSGSAGANSSGDRRLRQWGWGVLASAAGQGVGFVGAHLASQNCTREGWGAPCLGPTINGYLVGSTAATTLGTGLTVDLAGDGRVSGGTYLGSALGAGLGQVAGLLTGALLVGATEPATPGGEILLASVSTIGATSGSIAGYEIATGFGGVGETEPSGNRAPARQVHLRSASPMLHTTGRSPTVGLQLDGAF